jgi:hypothetical protein
MRYKRIIISFILTAAAASAVFGQSVPQPGIHTAPEVAAEIPINSDAFTRLWATMDSVHQRQPGKLSILYIGGSHVQAGWIGHFMREQMTVLSPRAAWSRGLMLPYRLAKTNTPTHFRTEMEGNWTGLRCPQSIWKTSSQGRFNGTGIQTRTASSRASIQHVAYLPDSTRFNSNAIDVWTNARANEFAIDAGDVGMNIISLEDNMGWRVALDAPIDTLRLTFRSSLDRSDPIAYEGLYSAHGGNFPRLVFNEWGHNGLHIADVNTCPDFSLLVERLNPDLIILGIGLNDALNEGGFKIQSFAAEYSKAITRIQEMAPQSALLLLSNTPVHQPSKIAQEQSARIQSFLQSCAAAGDFGFFDLGMALGGHKNTANLMANDWLQPDGIHYTRQGYGQIARLLYGAIFQAYQCDFHSRNSNEP